jgi:tetratricopeptide (TPR) repeat protein
VKIKGEFIIVVAVSLCITAFLVAINHINLSVRLNEMKNSLQEFDNREGSVDHIGLVATYEIHKKMYEERLAPEQADIMEQRLDSLVLREKEDMRVVPLAERMISMPALWVINMNRYVLGKRPLRLGAGEDAVSIDLDVAYYFERNFLFERAIEAYDRVLAKRGLDNAMRAGVLLHQGYCYALSGKNDSAMKNYQIIIRDFSGENSAVTATILSSYMEGFARARERILGSGADPLLRSRKLVNLMAYKQALDILEKEEASATRKDLAFIRFSKARCYTGLGMPAKAVETYLSVITDNPASEYAKHSNRKLFAIGSRAGGENEIRRISIRINERLKDPVLTGIIKSQGEFTASVPDAYRTGDLELPDKIVRQADIFLSRAEKNPAVARYLVIETSDGNTFKGTVLEETGEHIALDTSIGRINVKKDRISRITEKK